ncbi:AraC family transcriptional regulator [Coraliomargarita algicola]|uniref:AraC family transcriptional regulator n=1 Tax=Coraliomargarita algicola TaxID=3092156 RepID=A0ABZ0RXT0_9BACT|nr:AraC family transcriptional regulator [Coraliomargarita sp. J2-16]WPJ97819.1 AraC family transcriptional regulator [Coraliomargarita sp. J2-16]
MHTESIQQLIQSRLHQDGMVETGIKGVQLFRVTKPMSCAPAIYKPTVVAIVSGAKEAILDGKRYVYDNSRYLCCSISLPVEAGTPTASPDNPLLGAYISLDTRVMTQLAIEMESAAGAIAKPSSGHSRLALHSLAGTTLSAKPCCDYYSYVVTPWIHRCWAKPDYGSCTTPY